MSVLYSHLHCGHFIDLKSYFVFICYNFVNFNQIRWVILAGIKIFIPSFAGIQIFILANFHYSRKCGKRGNQTRFFPHFSGYNVASIVEMGIKVILTKM